jgi:5'-nucleotidase/UDP-sugar diphosphatase
MRKLILTLVAVTTGACLLAPPALATTLTILHTNDTHAHLLPWGPRDAGGNPMWGGMSKLATLIGMDRLAGGDILLVDAGDFSVGDFMFQEYLSIPELTIMKGLGYDAIALGNHEFDLYPSTLEYELDAAGFPDPNIPVLCANLDLSGDPMLGYFVRPYAVKQYGALKVGIVALLTEATNQLSNPSPIVVRPALAEAQAWVDSVEAQGCDLVIVLSHLGFDYDQYLASMVTGIDLIVGGHSHTDLDAPVTVGNTLIVQAGAFFRYLGKLTLTLDGGDITDWNYEKQYIDEAVPSEPTIAGMLDGLRAGVEADPRFGPVFTSNIASAGVDLTQELGPGLFKDTPLGNMLADAFRAKTGTDIALQPQGFCAQTIYQGPVRGNDIMEAVPYGFDPVSGLGLKLVTFETDGMSLLSGLEFTVYNLPISEDFVLQSSNMSYAYNSAASPGSRIDYSSVRVNGVPLDPFGSYSVTTSDAVVGFISQVPGFQLNNLQFTDDFVYTVARDYMVANSPVVYHTEGRVIDLAGLSDPMAGAAMLADAVDQLLADGSIDNAGIATALKAKLESIRLALAMGDYDAATDALGAFVHLLGAQSGKHISMASAQLLEYSAGQLMESLAGGVLAMDRAAGATRPAGLRLTGNYPNPFNPATQIDFTLGASSRTRLDIYNVLGQHVRTLVDGNLDAGRHIVTWDGTNQQGLKAGSGIYFYRITTTDQSATGKMLMLK